MLPLPIGRSSLQPPRIAPGSTSSGTAGPTGRSGRMIRPVARVVTEVGGGTASREILRDTDFSSEALFWSEESFEELLASLGALLGGEATSVRATVASGAVSAILGK